MWFLLGYGGVEVSGLRRRVIALAALLLVLSQVGGCSRAPSLKSWVGVYTFSEFAPPNQNMFYALSIFSEDDKVYATITIDGFQVMARMRARVSGDASSIQLILDEYLPDNVLEPYAKGDVLFSLSKADSHLSTIWGKIQPILKENRSSGVECFRVEPKKT